MLHKHRCCKAGEEDGQREPRPSKSFPRRAQGTVPRPRRRADLPFLTRVTRLIRLLDAEISTALVHRTRRQRRLTPLGCGGATTLGTADAQRLDGLTTLEQPPGYWWGHWVSALLL
jgi:hypothetical protein